ncbi:pyruvate, phosphate dikinase/phosphoenolpyruvate synthase regulator [Roseospira visakhapatnamensis]|uniref:pyruvate, phosphate dikinase/phosphoenolpyruvate synthase regulator n=1 Tax=Roseospira visakhapatnamensis TaxID=390880 RepID=UPI00161BA063
MVVTEHHLHLVSDATGETISSAVRACLVQFDTVPKVNQHLWWLVRTPGQVRRLIEGIQAHPGVVFFTLVDPEIRVVLEDACRDLGVPAVPLLDPVLLALKQYFQADFRSDPGRQHNLDDAYFRRIDAIHYTLAHDDGQLLEKLHDADVIVLGVSRTSKTPTCMYLANKGFKAVNIPLVPAVPVPDQVLALVRDPATDAGTAPLIVGLTREARSLSQLRRNRLRVMHESVDSIYADEEHVRDEVARARRLFARHGWPVIDVTRKSIEEVAAAIIQRIQRHQGMSW